ncbi:pyridoxamine 5'-phosphate oxidase [Levilactobacillus bambusae]|uniref:Pyridoxamine 5'-phosphate oxidase n=1 Tax=Levilactobacillus bambusae TaxID=2024736 RepID=A0A2V1MZ57_9LACO|nr:pyridoxamine 5'-phosphate oxidase [Levilactobacillus bambusae]PWG00301.1 pyridoxamine 5'-phosphate oxidase [Levilactobacillus bambusae]
MDTNFLQQVLGTADKIALSTSLDHDADVKIVNYVWYPDEPDTLYFSSVKDTDAVKIYDQNPDVAFITVPYDSEKTNPFVRGQHVTVQKSTKTIDDLLPRYLETVPGYQKVYDMIGKSLVVYEIKLHTVTVDAGLGEKKTEMTFG